jgi:dihydropteroate synthase
MTQIVKTKIAGILNLTPDSFSDGGKYQEFAQARICLETMILEGAKMIDIGAESTRPNSVAISAEEERRRLEFLPDLIKIVSDFNNFNNFSNEDKVLTSLDSYHFSNLQWALSLGVDVVNDVSGLENLDIIALIARTKAKTILMHKDKILPPTTTIINANRHLPAQIYDWALKKIKNLATFGVAKEQLIFDPGIGFGKNAWQSIVLLRNIAVFHNLNLPIYVGHSKKSFLEEIYLFENLADDNNKNNTIKYNTIPASQYPAENKLDRSAKTIAVSQFLVEQNIDWLRVHDVALHYNLLRFN